MNHENSPSKGSNQRECGFFSILKSTRNPFFYQWPSRDFLLHPRFILFVPVAQFDSNSPPPNRLLLRLAVELILWGKGIGYLWEGWEDAVEWKMVLGGLLVGMGLAIRWVEKQKWGLGVLGGVSGVLFVLAVDAFVGKGWQVQNLVEHGLQYGSPVLLGLVGSGKWSWGQVERLTRLLAGMTFLGHGIYAVGFQQDSTNFLEMTMALLPLDATAAHQFLLVVGILDLLAAAGMLFPRFLKLPLLYMIAWGLITALVRILIYWEVEAWTTTLAPAFSQTAIRLCHELVPLWLFLHLYPQKERPSTAAKSRSQDAP